MPPPVALDFFGDPFTPSGEVTIREDGFMRLDMRGGSIGSKDLYIDMPRDSLIKAEIKEIDIIEHVDVGVVRAGEVYRFYITSEFPMVSGQKLYPKYKYWNNYDRIAELRFDDWTDLRFDDLTVFIEVVEHPKTPRYIRLRSSPSEVLPDYDKQVSFSLERINKDYTAEDFPKDQKFDVQMDESKEQFATLHDPETGQRGTSLKEVSGNFHMDIHTYEEIEGFTGNINVEASTKVLGPVVKEKVEISGDWDVEIVNKKMFLDFSPNPVGKGDTALARPYLIYANGIQQYLPANYPLAYASVANASKPLGTLRNVATGETSDRLYNMPQGVQFVTRSDIPQDTAAARMVVSAYVDKEIPSEINGMSLSSQSISESRAILNNIEPAEKELMEQQFLERIESESVSNSINQGQNLEANSIGIMSHNSDQDYLYGYGNLLITDKTCDEEISPCTTEDQNPQELNMDVFETYSEEDVFTGKSVKSEEQFTTEVKGCSYRLDPNKIPGYTSQRLGVTFPLITVPIERDPGEPYYVPFSDMEIEICLLESMEKWLFNIDNLRIPLFSSYCSQHEYLNLEDGNNTALLTNHINSYEEYLTVVEDIEYWEKGSYSQLGEKPNKYVFEAGIKIHEDYHLNQLINSLNKRLNDAFKKIRTLHYEKNDFQCPIDVRESATFQINQILSDAYNAATSKQLNLEEMKQNEIKADDYSSSKYEEILTNIQNWAKKQPWFQ